MNIGEKFAMELEQESKATRQVLERVPEEKFDWQAHEKSMTMKQLASHIVTNLGWSESILHEDGLDFAEMDMTPVIYESKDEMLENFDSQLKAVLNTLRTTSDEKMAETWTMKDGERLFFELPKEVVMRSFVMNHGIHHRSQLATYLRLNDIPVPQIYGPTADEPDM